MESSTCLMRIKYGFSSLMFTVYILSISYLRVFFTKDFITLNISLLMIGFYSYKEAISFFRHKCKNWFLNFIEQEKEEYEMRHIIEHVLFCSDSNLIVNR